MDDVDAASENRAVLNHNSRRGQIAVQRARLADVDAVSGLDVACDLAFDDDSFGENVGIDVAVRADRQTVVLQPNRSFDLAVNV